MEVMHIRTTGHANGKPIISPANRAKDIVATKHIPGEAAVASFDAVALSAVLPPFSAPVTVMTTAPAPEPGSVIWLSVRALCSAGYRGGDGNLLSASQNGTPASESLPTRNTFHRQNAEKEKYLDAPLSMHQQKRFVAAKPCRCRAGSCCCAPSRLCDKPDALRNACQHGRHLRCSELHQHVRASTSPQLHALMATARHGPHLLPSVLAVVLTGATRVWCRKLSSPTAADPEAGQFRRAEDAAQTKSRGAEENVVNVTADWREVTDGLKARINHARAELVPSLH